MPERRGVPIDVVSVAKNQEERVSSESFLEPILNKPLTVERIDNYADDAVNELIFLLNQKVDDYKSGHNTGGWDDKSIENAALNFYGLESVNSYLDFLAQKDAEIRSLNGIIKKAGQVGEVIVRPDSYNPNIVGENGGEIKEKKMISRVKTVLFILKEDFEVDVNDESQLTLKKGILKDNMMRKTSYFLISVPKIDRTLLVCDEEGNASYVFNNKVLKDKGISEDILVGSTKEELNELMQQTPELGKRVVYSKDGFVPRMIVAIENPNTRKPDEVIKEVKEAGKYLYLKAPEGYLSEKGISEELNISENAIKSIVQSLGDQIHGQKLNFHHNITFGYSPEDIELIRKTAESRGLFNLPPEGYSSAAGMVKDFGIDRKVLDMIIKSLDNQLHGRQMKFGGRVTLGYSPEDIELIRKTAESRGLFNLPPEGYLLEYGIVKELGLSRRLVRSVISSLEEKIRGKTYRYPTGFAVGYSPEDIELIRKTAESRGLFNLPPEGYLSVIGIAKELDVDMATIRHITQSLGGEVHGKQMKFGGRVTLAYSPEDIELIRKTAESRGLLTKSVEEGYMSRQGLASKIGISSMTLQKIIDSLSLELGKVNLRKFDSVVTYAYDGEQQWKIIDYIRDYKRNLISEEKWRELDEEKRKWMENRTEK